MDATKGFIFQFLSQTNYAFYIPVYQREYSWDKARCNTLLEDLERLRKNKVEPNHFFGSIVYIPKYEPPFTNNWIIDGQQRLTTISLLILAIYRRIEELKKANAKQIDLILKQPEDKQDKNKIDELNSIISRIDAILSEMKTCFYKNAFVDEKSLEAKIKLSDVDNVVYQNILFKNVVDLSSNLGYNYDLFLSDMQKKSFEDVVDYYEAIKKLLFVHVYLDGTDDPQLIFESINSKLYPLTEADKIRNYIFMKAANYDVQKKLYNDYWKDIEINTNKSTTQLVKNYLIVKTSEYIAEDKLYYPFKKYMQEHNEADSETVLKDLLKYSEYIKEMNTYKYNSKEPYQKSIYYLLKLKTGTIIPLVISCLIKMEEDKISVDDMNEIMDYIESYIVRRNFMPFFTPKPLNKIFASMNKEAEKMMIDEGKSYKDAIIKLLSLKAQKSRFPSDSEFKENFGKKEIYSQRGFCIYILEKLSNFNKKELIDVDSCCNEGNLTIEHVMPQTLSPHWEAYLGPEFEMIHNKYVDTIGNLTLIAYNSELGNLPFKDKKKHEKGYLVSLLSLNDYIKKQDEWKEKQINDRANELLDLALQIWKSPLEIVTKKKKTIEEFKDIVLDDSFLDNPNTSIGMLARVSFVKLFENDLLDDEDINNLLQQKYSSENLGCWMPVLTEDEDSIYDDNGRCRYYAEGCLYERNGNTYYICSQFQDKNNCRSKLIAWVKKHIHKEN